MKRLIALLLAVFLVLGALSGCAGKPDAAQTDAPAPTELPTAHVLPVSTKKPAETPAPGESDAPAPTEPPAPVPPPVDLGDKVPMMWKVTDPDGHLLYLFGTIHVGDERNAAVLERVSPVLESCDALAVEFDIVAYQSDVQASMDDMMQYVLTDGSVVSDYMPEELYQRAYDLLQQAGLFPSMFKSYNLAMWYQLVDSAMILVYSTLDPNCGMDNLLINRAYEMELPVLDVESASFQMSLLNGFDNELYLILIRETLDSAETFNDQLVEMYELWLSGERDDFWAMIAGEEADEEDVGEYSEEQIEMILDFNRKLADDRNLGMRDRALEFLASGQTVFFAVGAAHMANEAGLVQLLTDAGCTVEPFVY